ncbi:MAG: hypothetical protein LLG14_02380, partial [Nocardiaceae bacterium]|nr:hypothetical protein [Nocardiaceae bacterium]
DNEATWGRDLGITDVAAWTRNRRGIVTYLGWATTYGANTATITTQGEDMALDANADYEAVKTMLQRALKFDVRPNGAGADARLGRTIWEQLNGIEKAASTPVTAEQVKVIADAVVAVIGQPTAAVDYALIAKTVNDEAARRLAS